MCLKRMIFVIFAVTMCACGREDLGNEAAKEPIATEIPGTDGVTNHEKGKDSIIAEKDVIPLTTEYFSSSVMLDYLKSNVDVDKNGILSSLERENVREIFFEPHAGSGDGEIFDGFEHFPNLSYVALPRCEKAVFKDCPSLFAVSGNEPDAYGELIFENCPELVSCGTTFHAARCLTVKNCKGLRYAYSFDAIHLRYLGDAKEIWTFEGVNNLELFGKAENLPDQIVADAGEATFVTYSYNQDGLVWNEDAEVSENGSLLIGGKERIKWTNSEGYVYAYLPSKNKLEEMILTQELLPESAGRINRIGLLSYSMKNGVAYAVETENELFVVAVGTDGNCQSYDSFVDWECERKGMITIDSAHFGSDDFCKYIQMNIDMNKDGVLSKEERMAVTEIFLSEEDEFCYREKSEVAKGFELFPNLKRLSTDNVENLIIQNHYALEQYTTGDSYLGRLFVENCGGLKEIGFYLVYGKSNLYVKNCCALEKISCTDIGIEDAIELVGTPCLVVDRFLLGRGEHAVIDKKISLYPESSILPMYWE